MQYQFSGKANRKPKLPKFLLCINYTAYTARATLPERKQRVHAYTLRGEPSTIAFTRFTFGFQVLLERL
jgi:hypothetical protein